MSEGKSLLSKIGVALDRGLSWCEQNPVKAGIIVGVGSRLIWEAGRAAKRHQISKIEAEKRPSVYDPALDQRWALKHELSNGELLEYQARLSEGQTRGDALRDMGLLSSRK